MESRLLHTYKPHLTDSLLRYAERLGFGDLNIKIDHETGLHAIIAIHSTKRGPAIGGCRFIHYDHTDQAIIDALRLAHMMTFKAAVNNLPHGGAKAVLIKPKTVPNIEEYFERFGEFVNSLNGRYITAEDSGTDAAMMDIIARRTPYVTGTTFGGYAGDPSPFTALGVRRGIEAALKFKLDRDNLSKIHVAIQGAGHVGYYLAKELLEQGAQVTMTDINQAHLQQCIDELKVKTVMPEAIYDVKCDVFAPCALGATLTAETIKRLQTSIVAGSANNLLGHHQNADMLLERGILYAPDFVINSGGLIHVAAIYDHGDPKKAREQIYSLYDTSLKIFERAARENVSPNIIAETIALENLETK